MAETAKLFKNGRSQAVRLPAEYRFEGAEVFIRRDEATGDVILSKRPASWADFFQFLDREAADPDFMKDRDQPPLQDRDIFE
jgi:antitoxin VapB